MLITGKANYSYLNLTIEQLQIAIDNLQEKINKKVLYGEFSYIEYNNDINLKNVSHRIKEFKLIDQDLFIIVEVLKTPSGKLVEQIIYDLYPFTLIEKFKMFFNRFFKKDLFKFIIDINRCYFLKFKIRSLGVINEDKTISDFNIITIDL